MVKPYTKRLSVLVFVLALVVFAGIVRSHCQVPCGIYDDGARFDLIAENIETMEKCNRSIRLLSKQSPPNMNQIVRWIETKQAHADSNADIITAYFLAQRIKPVDKPDSDDYRAYTKKLTQLHQLIVYSMKTKQSTEKVNTDILRTVLAKFKEAYLSEIK